jgi:hypothetical protein
MNKWQRITIVKQILDASPNLSSIVVAWRDFRHCSRRYSNLKHVHLLFNEFHDNPKHYFNIHRLNQLVPHLRTLETNKAIMMLDENLIEFILNIGHQFDQLVHLILNKNCLYRSKHEKKRMFRDKLITATHNQIFHGYNIHFEFHGYDELRIWF